MKAFSTVYFHNYNEFTANKFKEVKVRESSPMIGTHYYISTIETATFKAQRQEFEKETHYILYSALCGIFGEITLIIAVIITSIRWINEKIKFGAHLLHLLFMIPVGWLVVFLAALSPLYFMEQIGYLNHSWKYIIQYFSIGAILVTGVTFPIFLAIGSILLSALFKTILKARRKKHEAAQA